MDMMLILMITFLRFNILRNKGYAALLRLISTPAVGLPPSNLEVFSAAILFRLNF
jgi:hypothetical protein